MNPATKKYTSFEELKRLLVEGIIFASAIGLLWAILYSGDDIKFDIRVVLLHMICGAILGLSVLSLVNIFGIKVNSTGFLGFLLGFFWVTPILLFNIDSHYINLDTSIRGFLISSASVAVVCLAGFILGYSLNRFSYFKKLVSAIAFILIVPLCFALLFPEKSKSDITILNRLNGELANTKPKTRVMVLGIDGGAWDVIVPLMKKGKLPNLRSLMENGQYGILYSDAGSTWSPVVWTSIFTGKLPKKHGITEWELSDSRNRFSKSLWNIVNEYGQKALTVNIPGTFPPEKVLGIQISGFPIPGGIQGQGHGRLYSTESRKLEIVPISKIGIKPAEGWFSAPNSYSSLYESRIPSFGQVSKLREISYGFYTVNLSNLFLEFLGRRIFHNQEQREQYVMLIADTTDDSVVNYDTLYIFPNKDGSSPLSVLKEGQWSDWIRLAVNGAEAQFKLKLLDISKDHIEIYVTPFFQSSFSPQIPFTYPPNFATELSDEVGPYVVEGAGWVMYRDEIALDLLYEHLEDVADQHFRASEYLLKTIPDWALFIHLFTESDRVQHPYWKYFQAEQYKSVDKNLAKEHGEKVNSTMERIDAKIGKLLNYSDKNTTVVVVSDHGFQAKPSETEDGEHSPEGIYILSGNGVKNRDVPPDFDIQSFPKASLLDVTPTILYLMGYPIGSDMDGKVMLDIIDDKRLGCCQVKFIDSYDSGLSKESQAKQVIDESTKDQLKSLGYMK